jgi:hypothetical protein
VNDLIGGRLPEDEGPAEAPIEDDGPEPWDDDDAGVDDDDPELDKEI